MEWNGKHVDGKQSTSAKYLYLKGSNRDGTGWHWMADMFLLGA